MLCFLKHNTRNSLCARVVYSKSFPAMALRSGSSLAYSDITWDEVCESEDQTKIDLGWAFDADHDDTDFERDPISIHLGRQQRCVIPGLEPTISQVDSVCGTCIWQRTSWALRHSHRIWHSRSAKQGYQSFC